MFARDSIRGIIPPLATPLTRAEEVDKRGMAKLVEHVIGAGVHGVFVLGATGEFPFLSDRQRVQVVEAAVEAVAGRVPVVAGVSAIGTRQAIAHCRAAQAAGADFVIMTAPYFGSLQMGQEAVFGHVRAIAEDTGAQVMLYNVPPLIRDIEPTTIARLAALPNVVGMKDSASLIHVQDVLFRTKGLGFQVLCGVEYHLVAALLVGAHGGTPSPANLIPGDYVALYDRTISGDIPAALALQERVNRFSDPLDEIPSWFSAVKGALHLMGICEATTVAPVPSLSAEETELVRVHLARNGLLA